MLGPEQGHLSEHWWLWAVALGAAWAVTGHFELGEPETGCLAGRAGEHLGTCGCRSKKVLCRSSVKPFRGADPVPALQMYNLSPPHFRDLGLRARSAWLRGCVSWAPDSSRSGTRPAPRQQCCRCLPRRNAASSGRFTEGRGRRAVPRAGMSLQPSGARQPPLSPVLLAAGSWHQASPRQLSLWHSSVAPSLEKRVEEPGHLPVLLPLSWLPWRWLSCRNRREHTEPSEGSSKVTLGSKGPHVLVPPFWDYTWRPWWDWYLGCGTGWMPLPGCVGLLHTCLSVVLVWGVQGGSSCLSSGG